MLCYETKEVYFRKRTISRITFPMLRLQILESFAQISTALFFLPPSLVANLLSFSGYFMYCP